MAEQTRSCDCRGYGATGRAGPRRAQGAFLGIALGVVAALATAPGPLGAQTKPAPSGAAGNMLCWYDKSGRQLGCGNTVPPEFASYEIRELNRRGLTVKKTEAELTPEQVRARKEEDARRREAEEARAAARKRDQTLLASFTSEKEIEARRDRDLAQLDVSISGLQGELNQLRANETEIRRRIDAAAKGGKPVPTALRDEYLKAAADTAAMEKRSAERRAEQVTIRSRYDEIRSRFVELTRKP